MLKVPRLLQAFRLPRACDGFLTALSRQNGQTGRLPTTAKPSMATQRAFTTIRTSAWSQPPRLRNPSFMRTRSSYIVRNLRRNGTKSPPKPDQPVRIERTLSLSERMKQMSQKYGWTVVGIYLGLSVLDFPFCFLAVRFFGTERIGQVEHVLIDGFWDALEAVVPSLKERRQRKEVEDAANTAVMDAPTKKVHEDASIWTQLIFAYGVHKSLFFIRIPITLAITPRVVKVLRGWGWKIGKTTPKTA